MLSVTGIRYNVGAGKITEIIGLDPASPVNVDVCEAKAFNLPQYITIAGVQFFPLSYEFRRGDVWYLPRRPPINEIDVVGFANSWGDVSRRLKTRVTPRMLRRLETSSDQQQQQSILTQVMGKSATAYVQQLIDDEHLVIPPHLSVDWCWCPLMAFPLWQSNQTLVARHIVMATTACHSQMEMIAATFYRFVDETRRSISFEIFATVFPTTYLAGRIRYRLHEPASGTLVTEYVDACTTTHANNLDCDALYANVMAAYQGKIAAHHQ